VTDRIGGAVRLPLVAALVVLACAVPTTVAHAGTGATDTGSSDSGAVVAAVNRERAEAGCSAVTVDSRLAAAAQDHSQDQADHTEMTHTGSDGSSPGERATAAGYRWSKVAENVASGTTSPERVMTMWMNSSGHRANILNCAFRHVGVARVGGYWTQVFATPR
jgi:uncharacterized protein YkwD